MIVVKIARKKGRMDHNPQPFMVQYLLFDFYGTKVWSGVLNRWVR